MKIPKWALTIDLKGLRGVGRGLPSKPEKRIEWDSAHNKNKTGPVCCCFFRKLLLNGALYNTKIGFNFFERELININFHICYAQSL